MHTLVARWIPGAVVSTMLLAVPSMSFGQEAAAQASQPPASGRIVVERVQSGFVIAPDVRITGINDRHATLAGAYGGWQTDESFLVGVAAYTLTNRSDDFRMTYGGLILEWMVPLAPRVRFGARGLVGGGQATLSNRWSELFGDRQLPVVPDVRFGRYRTTTTGTGTTVDPRIRYKETFFVAEPQANVLLEVSRHIRLNLGVGYRFTSAADYADERLRGVSGSIGLQFGGS